jgi:hypothetical protein
MTATTETGFIEMRIAKVGALAPPWPSATCRAWSSMRCPGTGTW